MANDSSPQAADLIEVPVESFRGATRDIQFDVFLKLSPQNFAHVFSRTSGLDYKRLAGYIQKGVKSLYIRRPDEPLYRDFLAHSAHQIFLDPSSSQEKKIAMLLNMTEQNLAELFAQCNVSEETAEHSQKLIRSYVDVMTKSPNTLTILLKLVSHGEYLYYHSIAVAIFSIFLAKASGQFNQRMLEIVGMGGFLHDIGCTQIDPQILMSPNGLTDDQWVEMKSHCKVGLNMLVGSPSIPDEVRYIVYQHHEEPGGEGYPNGIGAGKIFYPAKIVALADAFSALISRRPYRPAYTVEQALAILQKETNKHDRELIKIMVSVFGRQVGGSAAPKKKAA